MKKKEHDAEGMLENVREVFEGLQQSYEKVYDFLYNFEESTTEIIVLKMSCHIKGFL